MIISSYIILKQFVSMSTWKMIFFIMNLSNNFLSQILQAPVWFLYCTFKVKSVFDVWASLLAFKSKITAIGAKYQLFSLQMRAFHMIFYSTLIATLKMIIFTSEYFNAQTHENFLVFWCNFLTYALKFVNVFQRFHMGTLWRIQQVCMVFYMNSILPKKLKWLRVVNIAWSSIIFSSLVSNSNSGHLKLIQQGTHIFQIDKHITFQNVINLLNFVNLEDC